MGHYFYNLYSVIKRFRFASFSILIGLLVFLWFGISKIQLEEDISKVLMNTKETEMVNQILENIDFSNKIVNVRYL